MKCRKKIAHMWIVVVSISGFFYSSDVSAQYYGNHQSEPRWYTSLGGSIAFIEDNDISTTGGPIGISPLTATEQLEIGYGVAGSIGHRIARNIRAEIELSHYTAEVENKAAFPVPGGGEVGAHQTNSLMANMYYDFGNNKLTPYIGGGLGAMYTKTHVTAAIISNPGSVTVEEKQLKGWAFAYQFMAGVNYEIDTFLSERGQLYLGYRYLGANEVDVESDFAPGRTYHFDHQSHHIDAGVRFYF